MTLPDIAWTHSLLCILSYSAVSCSPFSRMATSCIACMHSFTAVHPVIKCCEWWFEVQNMSHVWCHGHGMVNNTSLDSRQWCKHELCMMCPTCMSPAHMHATAPVCIIWGLQISTAVEPASNTIVSGAASLESIGLHHTFPHTQACP